MALRQPAQLRFAALFLGVLLLVSPAWAQGRPSEWLSAPAATTIGRPSRPEQTSAALRRLSSSELRPELLQRLLASRSAAPYLSEALPRLAELTKVEGINSLVERFISNGMGGAYELAVAHAHRQQLRAVDGELAGNQLDGQLRSGTILEAKSAPPKRPDHLLEQLRRRGAEGRRVVLAVGYRPSNEDLRKLRAVRQELNGRLEVQLIPLSGNGYKVLVPGRGVENPSGRVPLALPRPGRVWPSIRARAQSGQPNAAAAR